MKIGDLVLVKGRSRHGKNRIHEHGEIWKIRNIWKINILLESIDDKNDFRWVDGPDDCDFEILQKIEVT